MAARVWADAVRMLGGPGRERPGGDALPGPEDARPEAGPGTTGAGPGPPDVASGPPGGPRPGRIRPGGSRPARPRSRVRVSPALRRLMVTPTFAAGLGVVVAAFLAANMSRTVLHFSAPIPTHQCSAGACQAQQPHGGTLASARPGVHITPSVPDPSGPATGIQPGVGQPSISQQGGAAAAAGSSGGPQPSVSSQALSITYEQVEQWSGGFADRITISGLRETRAQTWSLAFGYPGARIAGVQGARWEPGQARGRRGPGGGVAWLGAAARVRDHGAADGDRGGPPGRAVRLRLRRPALPVRPGGHALTCHAGRLGW